MKVWILASVASFVLLGGDVWGAEQSTQEDSDQQQTKGESKSIEKKKTFETILTEANISPETKVQEIRSNHLAIVAEAERKGKEDGIAEYCPNLRKSKDNDIIKMILNQSQKKDKIKLKKERSLNYKGKKKDKKTDGQEPSTTINDDVISQPGVKYFSGLRRKYNGVFKLLPGKTLSEWEGVVLKSGIENSLNLQFSVDPKDIVYWEQYSKTELQQHTDKVYLYDTFNIAGISLARFMDKINFSLKGKTESKTWKDLPLREGQSVPFGGCDISFKTNCYTEKGWKANVKGCSFKKMETCIKQAQEERSKWLTKMLGNYFDYFASRAAIDQTRIKPAPTEHGKIPMFSRFQSKLMDRYLPYTASGTLIPQTEITEETGKPHYNEAKNAFIRDKNVRENAIYALILNEATKRHIDQIGTFQDKAFLNGQLTLLLQDAAEAIAQMKIITDGTTSAISRGVFGGSLSAEASKLIKKMIDEKEAELKKSEAQEVKETSEKNTQ